jgi:hypothetical protein
MLKIEMAPSNHTKVVKARELLIRVTGLLASSTLDFEHISGLLDGVQGLTQSVTDLLANIEVVKSGKGRPRKDNGNDIGEALEDDPRSPEEIADDIAMMGEVGMIS